MTKPPFKFVPNPESLKKAADIGWFRFCDQYTTWPQAMTAFLAAYMEAEHAAGRAREAHAQDIGGNWDADTHGWLSMHTADGFPVLILRLPATQKPAD